MDKVLKTITDGQKFIATVIVVTFMLSTLVNLIVLSEVIELESELNSPQTVEVQCVQETK